jgi:hypothetical protein
MERRRLSKELLTTSPGGGGKIDDQMKSANAQKKGKPHDELVIRLDLP